jgi:Ca2+-binding RTX toxin-like protein
LRFNGGANFEVKASYDVTVNVNDAAVGGSPDGTAALTLTIADVVETVNASLPTTSVAADDPNNHDSDTGTATISGANATGGAGNDVLVGNNGANTIAGGAGNDTIYGGSGNDSSLAGDDGNDTIYGQGGNDTVNGGNQNDFIYGGSGGDTLNGNAGNDTIYGGSGNDTIDGGADSDTIVGGYGADAINPGSADGVADTIRYLSLLDTNDSISNFVSGIDKIDLSGIDASSSLAGDQNFAWGGQETGPYVEANSVTWYTTGGNVIVLADTDGNLNTAEFSITLTGITSISSGDFNTL